ncbi:hypothetical protein SRABI36_04217 [Pedobacter sp. Bi36]|nr:hypothetical protein SRABI126_01006 [Pedobacter sp. Bi126]CAH0287908.1 hypothetical protein SRABI36_04217 [Pedobacter sp. Bi36]
MIFFIFRAQGLCRIKSSFPFFAFTLRCLVPHCCRVTLQPGLSGYSSISFVGLQDAQALVLKPDSSGSSRFFIGTIANGGTANCQEPQAAHFLIRISFISVGETPTDRIIANKCPSTTLPLTLFCK